MGGVVEWRSEWDEEGEAVRWGWVRGVGFNGV